MIQESGPLAGASSPRVGQIREQRPHTNCVLLGPTDGRSVRDLIASCNVFFFFSWLVKNCVVIPAWEGGNPTSTSKSTKLETGGFDPVMWWIRALSH